MFSFDIKKFVARLLPPFLRTDVQRAWLESLLTPVVYLQGVFNTFRSNNLTELAYTSQTLSLQGWLNRQFDPVSKRIKIIHTVPAAEYDYLTSEGQTPDYDYLSEEAQPYLYLYFDGENTGGITEDFIVLVPTDLTAKEPAIRAAVVKFKFSGIDYGITYTS